MEVLKHSQTHESPSLPHLFSSFLKLGATAFGGPAMVAYIRRMAVEQRHWLSGKSFHEGTALCQTIPGATAMQMAAYVGLRTKGIAGAAVSFIGFGLPAFFFMLILSALYPKAITLPVILSAFQGLQVIIVALVANATVSFERSHIKNWKNVFNTAFAAVLYGWGIHPILILFFAALLGLALYHQPPFPLTSSVEGDGKSSRNWNFLLLLLAAFAGYLSLFFLSPTLFDLSLLMARIDLFAFGGGFASVPLMFHEVVKVRSWLDAPTFINGIVLGQVTPGPIVITATFVGYLLYGLIGSLIATISIFLPSFLVVVGIVPYFDRLKSSSSFNKVMNGILCSFVGLLLVVTIRFALNVPWDIIRILIGGAAFIALLLKVDILWVVLIGTLTSIIFL